MHKAHLLIVDDEEKLRGLMARILGLEGYQVTEAKDIKAGLKTLEREDIDLVLCDVKLPDGNGIDATAQIKAAYPSTEVIVLTAYGNIKDGVKAIQNGAFDYLTKGDDNERLIPLVSRAVEKAQLQKRVQALEHKVNKRYGFDSIIGSSEAIKDAIRLAQKVAPTDATVLLTGETGTGKEVFAQAIHYNSPRSKKSFVAVNCSAFTKELLESELFGHKAGAFTGANRDQKGLFEEAHEGTLFLDEIGEMDLELQARLLRVLETGTFIKVGDTKTIKVNVRIIAATNRDLLKESEAGHFRSDLYYRLSVFQIPLPPLRERKKDIEALALHFIRNGAEKINRRPPLMDADFKKMLQQHTWKGNIRELKNILERAVILAEGDTLTTDLLPLDMQYCPESPNSFDLAVVEMNHIRKVLAYTKGNKTEAARLLNIGLATLYRKLGEE
ncbi:MAG: sigma-54 dependent transcriptional regulator [Chitinophagales bacterium]|nr:sigma-54 dependent transcriptional regulator [Chitinophagales bacterium]